MDAAIDITSKAPNFDLATNGGQRVSLADYAGRYLVLYFYPKDDTSGCTKQALTFTEHLEAFQKLNADILGVSKDSVASHDKFIAKHNLGITLGSDENLDVCKAYGVWVQKKMYGREYMGIERSTFLIGPDSRIIDIWRKVKVAGHSDAVLDKLQSL